MISSLGFEQAAPFLGSVAVFFFFLYPLYYELCIWGGVCLRYVDSLLFLICIIRWSVFCLTRMDGFVQLLSQKHGDCRYTLLPSAYHFAGRLYSWNHSL